MKFESYLKCEWIVPDHAEILFLEVDLTRKTTQNYIAIQYENTVDFVYEEKHIVRPKSITFYSNEPNTKYRGFVAIWKKSGSIHVSFGKFAIKKIC